MTVEEVQAGQIVLKEIAPFVVGVFTKRHPEDMDWTFATGTAIKFKGVKLVLTAAHVLSDPPFDLVFLPAPSGGFTVSKSLEGSIYPRSQRWDVSQVVGDRHTDVAAIIFRTPPQIAFFDIGNELPSSLAAGRPVAICGYPKAKSKAVQIGSLITDLALLDFQGASIIDAGSFSWARPFQFAIDYPQAAGIAPPGGYSGAMVWYDKADCRTLDQLQRGLALGAAGIVTDHAPAHEALLCTTADAIIRFLSETV
jgi:hypothetical protein